MIFKQTMVCAYNADSSLEQCHRIKSPLNRANQVPLHESHALDEYGKTKIRKTNTVKIESFFFFSFVYLIRLLCKRAHFIHIYIYFCIRFFNIFVWCHVFVFMCVSVFCELAYRVFGCLYTVLYFTRLVVIYSIHMSIGRSAFSIVVCYCWAIIYFNILYTSIGIANWIVVCERNDVYKSINRQRLTVHSKGNIYSNMYKCLSAFARFLSYIFIDIDIDVCFSFSLVHLHTYRRVYHIARSFESLTSALNNKYIYIN